MEYMHPPKWGAHPRAAAVQAGAASPRPGSGGGPTNPSAQPMAHASMKKSVTTRGGPILAALAAIVAGAFLASQPVGAAKPDDASATANATYSGQAIALRIDGTIDPPSP